MYWKPTYNILEGACEVVLANARDIKKFRAARRMCVTPSGLRTCSGTDSSGAALSLPSPSGTYATWCATAKALIREKASEINRLQKALEGMNIKLASVATNVLGMSGRAMLEAIAAGCTDAEALAEMGRGRLRNKIPELETALEGRVDPTTASCSPATASHRSSGRAD